MRYAGIIPNDLSAAPGVCVSVFTQGCPHHCPGCHNPETWDFEGGKEFEGTAIDRILNYLQANGVQRDLCIMGGEPLCPENQFLTLLICNVVKERLPDTKIYIWTGYVLEDLTKDPTTNKINQILDKTYAIIDGPYIKSQRDVTIPMRGSRNQRVLYKGKDY